MKKTLALLLATVMVFALCACGANPAPAAAPAASETEAAPVATTAHFDKLALEFVPSHDTETIMSSTTYLGELVKAEMAKLGYEIDNVVITVGSSYEATGEAMADGTVDVGWLPGGTYAAYSDKVDVMLTATRKGISNDSLNPDDWNGDSNRTNETDEQVSYYRALIVAGPSKYGRELAKKQANGEPITWEDLEKATWAVQKTTSSAGYIYPSMWLMENYDGMRIGDLSNVIPLKDGYFHSFELAAEEKVDIITCYAGARLEYENAWKQSKDADGAVGRNGLGRKDSIWNEMTVIGVTDGIYNDTVSISKASQLYTPELVQALQTSFKNIISTEAGKGIFKIYSHTNYVDAVDADYNDARDALLVISD